MKFNIKNNLQFVLILIILLTVCTVWESGAQPPPGFDPVVDDSTVTPISGLVGIALVVGAYFGVRKIKHKDK